ncbi:hypothetical protein GCM10022267_75730 [Lentzea roselyniae]|uniref:Uncharacterized protein n=1 Tax=Lentzea roselyniae TaxID=531940 RepID=A0ABP7C664_9PSEU
MSDTITVARVGHALLVGTQGCDREAEALAAALAPEQHRTAVVVGESAVDAVSRLDPWVIADLDEHVSGGLRLLAPHLGACGPAGHVPPARLLADRLGVEVVAPDNDLHALPDGTFFVWGPGAGWVSYRPGGAGRRTGPRHPAPWWQEHLPTTPPEGVEQIPMGLWVRAPGGPARPADPLLELAADSQRLTVVIGAPGEPAPSVSAITGLLRSLPGAARDRTVLTSYGDHDVAQAVADAMSGAVRAQHAPPIGATWRPFAVESVHLPGAWPALERWTAPAPSLPQITPAVYRLAPGWRVEVVPRGLVMRPDALPFDRLWSAPPGATADLVLAADEAVPESVVTALGGLVRDLPADARNCLRVLPCSPFAVTAARQVPELSGRVENLSWLRSEQRPALVVTADGRLLPSAPLLAPPTAGQRPAEPPAPRPALAARKAEVSSRTAANTARPTTTAATEVKPVEVEPVVQAEFAAADRSDRVAEFSPLAPVDGNEISEPATHASLATELSDEDGCLDLRPASPADVRSLAVTAAVVPPSAPATSAPAVRPPDTAPATSAAVPEPARVARQTTEPVAAAPVEPAPVASPPLTPASAAPTPATPSPTVAAPPNAAPPTGTGLPSLVPSAPTRAIPTPSPATTGDTAPASTPTDRQETPPEPETRTAPTEPAPTHRPIPLVPPDARSTPEQRARLRTTLGDRYDMATRVVSKLLAERPGLRSGGDTAALMPELTAVRVFAVNPDDEYNEDFHTCLTAGLRRMPTLRGVVVRGVPGTTGFVQGDVLTLQAPTPAVSALPPIPVTGAELLIWTTTGRRLDGLLDGQRSDVVLPAHTRLRVLLVEDERVLLAEQGVAAEQAMTRLKAAVVARAATPLRGAPCWSGPLEAK